MTQTVLFTLSLVGFGCSGADLSTDSGPALESSQNPDSDVDADADADAEMSFSPTTGTWTVNDLTTISDECGVATFSSQGGAGSTLDLTVAGDDDFRLTYADGPKLDCTFTSDDGAYTCDVDESTDSSAQDLGIDCLITLKVSASGEFSSANSMNIYSEINMETEGDGCIAMEAMGISMPCLLITESTVSAL